MERGPDPSTLIAQLETWQGTDDEVLAAQCRRELPQLIEFARRSLHLAECARALLENAFAAPADEHGVRLRSEDAVKLQWALRGLGLGIGVAGESEP